MTKARFRIKKLKPKYWAIFRKGCQICHAKTKQGAYKRIKELRNGKQKERLW